MDGTILSQGSFLANLTANPIPGTGAVYSASAYTIQIPSAADWVSVRNFTQFGTAGVATARFNGGAANAVIGREFFWQRGMAPGQAIVKYYTTGGQTLTGDVLNSGGMTIYDPTGLQANSQPLLGTPTAVTAVSSATQPVVTTGSTAGLFVGGVVRLFGTTATDVNGIDFIVSSVTTDTSFTLLYATNSLATATGGGTGGYWQQVYYPPLYYPARKIVTDITQAATNAIVSTAVEHSMTVGQVIRFNIPAASGMTQLNPTPKNNYLYATVTNIVGAYAFTIDTNTSAFTAFTWPTIAQMPSSFPTYEPVGMNTAFELGASINLAPLYQSNPVNNANNGTFADATINTGYYGMILGSGAARGAVLTTPIIGPAGTVTYSAGNAITSQDLMFWVAGKADFGGL